MLFKARLRWREKFELLILFSGGLFVMMAGILRCVLILTVSLNHTAILDFSSGTDGISPPYRLGLMAPSKPVAGLVAKPSLLSSLATFP